MARRKQRSRSSPPVSEGRDQRDQRDEPRVDHQLRDLGDAANVLGPVGCCETEVAAQSPADLVAVEQAGQPSASAQLALDQVGDR
jgi:hypothetical protein